MTTGPSTICAQQGTESTFAQLLPWKGDERDATVKAAASAEIRAARERTATRTATGLVQASTQWTSSLARSAQNPIDKRNFRTHQDGLERVQANS
jgi:hypothetical protein